MKNFFFFFFLSTSAVSATPTRENTFFTETYIKNDFSFRMEIYKSGQIYVESNHYYDILSYTPYSMRSSSYVLSRRFTAFCCTCETKVRRLEIGDVLSIGIVECCSFVTLKDGWGRLLPSEVSSFWWKYNTWLLPSYDRLFLINVVLVADGDDDTPPPTTTNPCTAIDERTMVTSVTAMVGKIFIVCLFSSF